MGGNCSKESGTPLLGSDISQQNIEVPSGGPHFMDLNQDVVLLILSFVSYAPSELNSVSPTEQIIEESQTEWKQIKKDEEELNRLINDYNLHAQRINNRAAKAFSAFRPREESMRVSRTRTGRFGTLTHVFPLVNHQWYILCHCSDILWEDALLRLIGGDASAIGSSDRDETLFSSLQVSKKLWQQGLVSFIETNNRRSIESSDNETAGTEEIIASISLSGKEVSRLILEGCHLLKSRQYIDDNSTTSKEETRASRLYSRQLVIRNHEEKQEKAMVQELLFRMLLDHVWKRLPLFYKPGEIRIMGIHLNFSQRQARDWRMVNRIMKDRTHHECQGFPMKRGHRPIFVYAFSAPPLDIGISAWIVEVRQCYMFSDGRADISVVPVRLVKIEDIEGPSQGQDLMYAVVSHVHTA